MCPGACFAAKRRATSDVASALPSSTTRISHVNPASRAPRLARYSVASRSMFGSRLSSL